MNRLNLSVACIAANLLLFTPQNSAAQTCELELVLAVDVSGSVNAKEYDLQTQGLAAAFRSADIVHLIQQTSRRGEIYATVVQWSGAPHQKQIVGWKSLHDEASVLAFSNEIISTERSFKNYSTAIGEMMTYTGDVFSQRSTRCRRRVIDVSGDGPNNEGVDIAPARLQLLQAGITINGLAIIGEEDDLAGYYRNKVIGGDGAFMMTAATFADFPTAIRRKLLREIAPPITFAPPFDDKHARLSVCSGENPSC